MRRSSRVLSGSESSAASRRWPSPTASGASMGCSVISPGRRSPLAAWRGASCQPRLRSTLLRASRPSAAGLDG
eukprot:3116740-Alexandrium_andersonii.AAC.1